MRTKCKRFVTVIIAFILVYSTLFGILCLCASASSYSLGDIIEFGSYPQTEIKDNTLIATLNECPQTWHSLNYYSGTGSYSDGKMEPSDYMQFTDIEYPIGSGVKYRGIRFSSYRPIYTGYPLSLSQNATFQYLNGYYTNITYWFSWDTLRWRVLDPDSGLLLCESIIDSQPINSFALQSGTDEYNNAAIWGDSEKTHYTNNYAGSSIRKWLTDESDESSFLNTAFTEVQKNEILTTSVVNTAFDAAHGYYGSETTDDKVFLLSWEEIKEEKYGFNSNTDDFDGARRSSCSDYAECQGIYVYSGHSCSPWWLRTAGINQLYVCD